MNPKWRVMRSVISILTVLSTVLGIVPWAPVSIGRAEVPAEHQQKPLSADDPPTMTISVYLPLVMRSYVPFVPLEVILQPGETTTLGSPLGDMRATFTSIAVTQTTVARYAESDPPAVPPNNLAVAGQAFSITAEVLATGQPVTYFPYQITVITTTPPWYSVYTPSVIITKTFTDPETWGLDLSVLSLYRRTGPERDDWVKVPSAVYLDKHYMVAEVDTIGEYVLMSRLAIYAQGSSRQGGFLAQAPMTDTSTFKKLVLDPDRDEAWGSWPGEGTVHEGAYAVRLAKAVRDRLLGDRCRVDVLVTREDEGSFGDSPSTRAQQYRQFGGDTLATFAFNSLTGGPWGWSGDGGSIIWSGGDGDDNAFRDAMGNWMGKLGRPVKYDGAHAVLPYADFVALSGGYMHMETLYLDHNYDWPIINTGFDSVADMAYAGVRSYLESKGMYCGDDPNNPPPYPEPPSAELLQRWRDLGYQNFQRYGADPVSFSTGNHVVQARLTRIPARGGLDWDFTLTYNSQDTRDDLFGYNWSFPYNARAQVYSDNSVTVVLWDGRTYHYTPSGDGYDAPAGVFDRLEKTDEGWEWITPNDVTLTFSETVGGFGILTEWQDRNGNALHYTYDLSEQNAWQDGNEVPRPPLTAIRNDAGRAVNVTNNADGHITKLDLWDGRDYTFEYNGEGNLTRINGPDGQLRRFEYDDRHRMTKEWDAEDILFLQSSYDDRDRVTQQIDASGTPSTLSYDVANRRTTFTDNAGNDEVYNWDELNRVTDEQDAGGSRVSNTYDADYNLTDRTDANGNTTIYAYDERGNVTARYDPLASGATYTSDVTRWAYDAHNRVISMTNALGNTWRYFYDARGNLRESIAPDGSRTTATYNAWGQPDSITDAEDRTTTYDYDGDGNLIKTTYPDGTFSSSTYDDSAHEMTYTDANGNTVAFEYDDRDNITRITDPKTVPSTFEYDGNDLLTRSVNRRGDDRLYRYDENLKLSAERDEEELWTTYGYDTLYRRVAMTDTAGSVTRYAYDDAGKLVATTDPTGATTSYTHDDNGNVIAVTDALNNTTRMIYDAANRLKYLIDANGNRTEYCYDAEDQLVRTIGPRGEVTDYTYDMVGRLVAVKDPLGNVTRYEHDAVGNRTAMINPLDERTDYVYNDMDRVVSIAAPELAEGARATTQFGYDPVGNTLVITSPNGFATTFVYDDNDNVTTITDPLGGQTSYTYDAEDTPLSVTDANDHTESTVYNKVGLPVLVEDALGYTTTLRYDDAYNMAEMINAMGRATVYDYDPLGRLLTSTDPLDNVTTYTRDALGRVTQVTDANEHAIAYDYDALGQLITVTDALSGTTAYDYDGVGNLTVITDANQSVTRFEYNFLNQLKREINPLDKTWEYWYDDAGRLTRRRDAMWHATYYDYNSNGRLTEISYGVTPMFPSTPGGEIEGGGQHPVTFTYDLEGNEIQMCDGLLDLSGVEGGCTTHTYDALGRPTSTTDWLGRTITRTYDAMNNFTSLTYPNGAQTQYHYNDNDWLTMFVDPHSEASLYMRNPLGQVTEVRYSNNTLANFDYDNAGRLTGIVNSKNGAAQAHSAYQYAMDKVGNRTQVIETRSAFDGSGSTVDLVHSYAYDALDRLISAATDTPGTATGYAFDAVGNRLGKTGTVLAPDASVPELPVVSKPEQNAYTYNAANQLTEINEMSLTTNLDYNANGDRIHETEVLTDGTTLFTDYVYDREDRLVGVTKSVSDSTALTVTMVATYTYDGYGRRALKEVLECTPVATSTMTPTMTSQVSRFTYLYDGLDIIGVQLEQGGVVTETYYYLAPSPLTGLRRPFEMERLPNAATGFAGDLHWYQSDGLDSVVALTDESGDLASPFLYDEYGQMLAGSTELQVFAYTAQDYDVETGLYHFHARYYDPQMGIWLTQDTWRGLLQNPLTLHRYGYVNGKPVSWFDVQGEFPWLIVIPVVVGVVAAAGILYAALTDETPPAPPEERNVVDHITGYSDIKEQKEVFEDPEATNGDKVKAGAKIVGHTVKNAIIAGVLTYGLEHCALAGYELLTSAGTAACADGDCTNEIESLGSTGRTTAMNLAEQLAMEAAKANPAAGREVPLIMNDSRWLASEGWVKMTQFINGIEIHYVYNTITKIYDDFKFID